jgi:hypothetical protein
VVDPRDSPDVGVYLRRYRADADVCHRAVPGQCRDDVTPVETSLAQDRPPATVSLDDGRVVLFTQILYPVAILFDDDDIVATLGEVSRSVIADVLAPDDDDP